MGLAADASSPALVITQFTLFGLFSCAFLWHMADANVDNPKCLTRLIYGPINDCLHQFFSHTIDRQNKVEEENLNLMVKYGATERRLMEQLGPDVFVPTSLSH